MVKERHSDPFYCGGLSFMAILGQQFKEIGGFGLVASQISYTYFMI
jgi:hypothetical protein